MFVAGIDAHATYTTPEDRRDPQARERVRSNVAALDAQGWTVVPRQVHCPVIASSEVLEDRLPVPEVPIVLKGNGPLAGCRGPLDDHQSVEVLHRQNHEHVADAVGERGDADAQAKRDNGRDGEKRRPDQHPDPKP
jgi:hypothetical protein